MIARIILVRIPAYIVSLINSIVKMTRAISSWPPICNNVGDSLFSRKSEFANECEITGEDGTETEVSGESEDTGEAQVTA